MLKGETESVDFDLMLGSSVRIHPSHPAFPLYLLGARLASLSLILVLVDLIKVK